MSTELLSSKELSEKWDGTPSEKTIDSWGIQRDSIAYAKLGGPVKYQLYDVFEYCHRKQKITKNNRRSNINEY